MKIRRSRSNRNKNLLENQLGKSEQFQELKKKLKKEWLYLTNEMRSDHVPIFYHWIARKLEIIDETMRLMDERPVMSINDLASQLDNEIVNQDRKLNRAKGFEEMEAICNNLSALEWTRNLVRTIDLKYRL